MNKIDFNKRMIGQDVCLTNHTPEQVVEVVGVVDDESFLVKMTGGQVLTVSIYDIRSLEDEKGKRG
tara:strand:- start:1693 stop:1890 length:198 start_codon:yes stop_codon:yes gene_type:complete